MKVTYNGNMNRQEAYNEIYSHGFDYSAYVDGSERHQERMTQAYEAAEAYVGSLDHAMLELCNTPMKVLCIAESWCGDCGNGVPVIAKLAELMDQWQFTIAKRDDFEEIVDQYYTTAGRKKIPVIVFADLDGEEIGRWVERPAESYKLLVELQAKRLPKEEYIEEYRSHASLRPPKVAENIVDELLQVAFKSANLNRILPKKKSN